jgi:hypothetical protein
MRAACPPYLNLTAGVRVSVTLYLHNGKCSVRTSAGTPANLTDGLRGFPQNNAAIRSRPFPSKSFLIHRTSHHSTLYPGDQWFSTFVRPRPGCFFFYKMTARYWAAARRLRNNSDRAVQATKRLSLSLILLTVLRTVPIKLKLFLCLMKPTS